MKAVIMAGGEGTRLRPLTSNQPKPMLPMANVPMMEHVVNLLRTHGFEDMAAWLTRDFELAAPEGSVNCSQSLPGVFKNMDLHRAPPLISAALRIVTVKLIRNRTRFFVNE